ncbi:MAG: pseudouridine synthase [Candidatus Komeilibacteria bacterium]
MRLQKFLASAGIASRRGAEEIIKRGLITVNGEVVTEMGVKIDPDKDKVTAYGKKVSLPKEHVYLMVNKPAGYITTANDPYNRKTVYDLIPEKYHNLFPVGRLDKDSEGLLLFTDDGELAQQLTHPKFEHSKEYFVRLDKKITRELFTKLKYGIKLDEGVAKVDKLDKKGTKELSLTLHQGWKRQIRRMMEEAGFEVELLQRTKLANYNIEDLKNKPYKLIDKQEII